MNEKEAKMKNVIIKCLRKYAGRFLYAKRLPNDFGNVKILVTCRSDIRLLRPGLEHCLGDLFTVLRKYVKKDDVVWDVGSNLGVLAFGASQLVGKKGAVYSVEADPKYADIQTETIRKYLGSDSKVVVLCAAAADKVGVLDFVIPKKGHSRNHLAAVAGNSAGEMEMLKQVVTLPLDFLLDEWRAPDFIKIDVEGAELMLLEGAHKLFETSRPICYIECSSQNSEELTAYFKAKNYRLFSIDLDGVEVELQQAKFNSIAKPEELCVTDK